MMTPVIDAPQTNTAPMSNAGQMAVSAVSPVLAQQRQIMALMGLDVWVQRDKSTVMVDYDELARHSQTQSQATGLEAKQVTQGSVPQNSTSSEPVMHETSAESQFDAPSIESAAEIDAALSPDLARLFDMTPPDTAKPTSGQAGKSTNTGSTALNSKDPLALLKQKVAVKGTGQNPAIVREPLNLEPVEPFEVLGVHYHGWVLLADIAELRESQTLQLWENLLNALSVRAQHQQFPICDGITDKESANASVAGFIFCLAKSECANVIAVTPLPNGIEQEHVTLGPYLTDMLTDSSQKKVLWQRLNQQSNV